jgi:hypothetical protein
LVDTTGRVSAFSAPGPVAGFVGPPAFKPDLVAPGEWIVAARSRDAAFPPDQIVGAEHVALEGTSQAAAMVTGAVALLLELDPQLDSLGARGLLLGTTRIDGLQDRRAWNPKWGWGRIDLLAAVEAPSAPAGVAVAETSGFGISQDVVRAGDSVVVAITLRDASGGPADSSSVVIEAPGAAYFEGSLGPIRFGEIVVEQSTEMTVWVDGTPIGPPRPIFVASSRRRVGTYAFAAGGCSAAARPSSDAIGAALALVTALVCARRKLTPRGARP